MKLFASTLAMFLLCSCSSSPIVSEQGRSVASFNYYSQTKGTYYLSDRAQDHCSKYSKVTIHEARYAMEALRSAGVPTTTTIDNSSTDRPYDVSIIFEQKNGNKQAYVVEMKKLRSRISKRGRTVSFKKSLEKPIKMHVKYLEGFGGLPLATIVERKTVSLPVDLKNCVFER